MGSLCQCLFQICCDSDDDDDEYHRYPHGAAVLAPPLAPRMNRAGYQAAATSADEAAEAAPLNQDASDTGTTPARQVRMANDETATPDCHAATAKSAHHNGIQEFFRRLQDRWQKYDTIDNTDAATVDTKHSCQSSPLRKAASSFDSSREIPTIEPQQVVVPGSDLQAQMAKAMASHSMHEDDHDECVICMEGFDASNPRMPTLCGCGENATYFHLPCLYQWVEQCPDCPSCRQQLTWEEF